jgi:hypothetical protein
MVAPLAVIALVWERRDWGSSRLLQGRRVRVGFGRLAREMPLGTLASGVVLIGMGVLTLVTAVTGPSMSSSGWRVSVTAWLQHVASVTSKALSWLPGWAVLGVLAVLAGVLAWQARRSRLRAVDPVSEAEAVDGAFPSDTGVAEMNTASARGGQEAVTHER